MRASCGIVSPRELALQNALEEVLACPACHGSLVLDHRNERVRCTACNAMYPVIEGIPILLPPGPLAQDRERVSRNAFAAEHRSIDREALLEVAGQHHCAPVMRRQAARFGAQFAPDQWILDLGIGWGWQWDGRASGPNILGVDMSLGNLVLARRLLDDDRITLVCADAVALPIRDASLAGLWSVQVFQHLPAEVLERAIAEADRVLQDDCVIETSNLNPALLLRAAYRLTGKRLHLRGRVGDMELNRRSTQAWLDVWSTFRPEMSRRSVGYSELFFHPDLRVRPKTYPVALERFMVARASGLSSLFARQACVRIEAKARR